MNTNSLPTQVVEAAKFNMRGTLIDDGWFDYIKYENGKPNMNAILILSEIIYWYKPTTIKNEVTGSVEGYKKKFKADKLQKNYESLGDRFGISKRQAKAACDFLKERGLITVEFRNFRTKDNIYLSNVMYVEPIMANILEISSLYNISPNNEQPLNEPLQQEVVHSNVGGVVHSNVGGVTADSDTYTKTTTKTTKPLYKGEEQTDVLNDVLPREDEVGLEFIDEATILLEKMPNKEGSHRFPLTYRDKRKLHSKDELFRTVDRYIESVKLLGRDMVVGCANFFSREHYIEFLDVNWENTLDNINKQVERRKFNKNSSRTKSVNEPEGLEEWSEGLDDIFK